MTLSRRGFVPLAAIGALSAFADAAWAQAYPSRLVRVIVAYAPGGLTDVFGRLLAQKLSEHMGKQFYIENITGASGNIGMAQAARAGRTVTPSFAPTAPIRSTRACSTRFRTIRRRTSSLSRLQSRRRRCCQSILQ